jgi:hypothetical protein
MGVHAIEKKELSARGMLNKVRSVFEKIPDNPRDARGQKSKIPLTDCLMAGLAMFSLKMPSLLQFNNQRNDEIIKHNLQTLYGIESPPSDTYMRERLDPVDPEALRPAYKAIFRKLQRGKVLEDYVFMNDRYLVPLDGTGVFLSNSVHCKNCCEKHHQNGSITYHHQILSAVIVHPDLKEVFPLCPEPIIKQDGKQKNDCETNACHRLLADLIREHPHLKVIVTGDAIHSSGPRITQLKADDMQFILGVKPGSHESLFEWISGLSLDTHEMVEDGIPYTFRWANQVPLNDTYPDLLVNFLDCIIDDPKNGQKHFSWVTDIPITRENVYKLSQGGRAKWKIENETFNTLKNQGYNFEHNYGHGNENLSTIFSMLMMLAFFIDQVQQRACGMFQAALTKMKTRTALWEKIRSLFTEYYVDAWADLFYAITTGQGRARLPAMRPP